MWVVRDNSGISPHPASPLYLEAASHRLEDEGGAAERTQEPCRMTTEATALGSSCSHVSHGVSLGEGDPEAAQSWLLQDLTFLL